MGGPQVYRIPIGGAGRRAIVRRSLAFRGSPPIGPRAGGQKLKDAGGLEELADTSARVRNLQNATRSARRVEGADELAHAGGIEVGQPRQIKQNSPLATD